MITKESLKLIQPFEKTELFLYHHLICAMSSSPKSFSQISIEHIEFYLVIIHLKIIYLLFFTYDMYKYNNTIIMYNVQS